MKPFESFLAPLLQEYLDYCRNLGYSYKSMSIPLRAFDQYLKQTRSRACVFDPPFFLEMRANLRQEPVSINTTLSGVRGFFRYLVRKGIYSENPLQDISAVQVNPYFPFLFSRQQTEQLLQTACSKIRKRPYFYLRDLSI